MRGCALHSKQIESGIFRGGGRPASLLAPGFARFHCGSWRRCLGLQFIKVSGLVGDILKMFLGSLEGRVSNRRAHRSGT